MFYLRVYCCKKVVVLLVLSGVPSEGKCTFITYQVQVLVEHGIQQQRCARLHVVPVITPSAGCDSPQFCFLVWLLPLLVSSTPELSGHVLRPRTG